VPRFNRGGSEKGERAGVEKKRRGKGKGRRHDGRKGGRKAWGIRMGGLRHCSKGDRRHCLVGFLYV